MTFLMKLKIMKHDSSISHQERHWNIFMNSQKVINGLDRYDYYHIHSTIYPILCLISFFFKRFDYG